MDFSQIALHPSFGSVHVRPGAQGFDGLSTILLLAQSPSIKFASAIPAPFPLPLLLPAAGALVFPPPPFRPHSRCWTPLTYGGAVRSVARSRQVCICIGWKQLSCWVIPGFIG